MSVISAACQGSAVYIHLRCFGLNHRSQHHQLSHILLGHSRNLFEAELVVADLYQYLTSIAAFIAVLFFRSKYLLFCLTQMRTVVFVFIFTDCVLISVNRRTFRVQNHSRSRNINMMYYTVVAHRYTLSGRSTNLAFLCFLCRCTYVVHLKVHNLELLGIVPIKYSTAVIIRKNAMAARLWRFSAWSRASPQNHTGRAACVSIDRAFSSNVLLIYSANLVDCEV